MAADFNRDGATDLLVGSVGGGPLRLFLNRFPKRNFAQIRLIGMESNRSGIGARLIAQVGERQIFRDVFPANGFMGQGPVEVNIGLGDADHIDQLRILWPTGATEQFTDLPAMGRITVTEGQQEVSFQRFDPM